MNKKWIVKLTVICGILLLTAGVIFYGRVQETDATVMVGAKECMLEMTGSGVSVHCITLDGEEFRINSWEKDGELILFLPSVLKNQRVAVGEEELILQEGDSLFVVDAEGNERYVKLLFGSQIPFVSMTTESGTLDHIRESKANRETGSLCMITPDWNVEYAGNLSLVRKRGNATAHHPKLPFRIKLETEASLAGIGASRDYVLLAEYGDVSLMRNKTAMELANALTDRYQPEGEYIDLYVNGEYLGVYLLCGGIEVGENRVDIADLEYETELANGDSFHSGEHYAIVNEEEDTLEKGYKMLQNPEDITGGYLMELEYHGRYEGEETTGFRTERDWSLVIKAPEMASREQVQYIKETFQYAENAMYEENWIDPVTGKSLEELVDLESFVHKYIVDEVCMNTDLWTSQFLYKDRQDDKIYFGPVWDFDMAFGHYDTGLAPDEFYANWHIWYGEVYDNPLFWNCLQETYKDKCLPELEALTETKMKEWKELLFDSAAMNFTRWNIEDIYLSNFVLRTGESFEECVDSLEQYIRERTEFLSSEWLENP